VPGFLGDHGFVGILDLPIFRYAAPLTAWYLLRLGGVRRRPLARE